MKSRASISLALVLLLSSYAPGIAKPNSIDKDKFPLSLYKSLAKERKGKNLLLSPYSVSTALTMTANGAGGKTKSEMAKVLGFSGVDSSIVNQRCKTTSESLKSLNKGTKLEIANVLFGSKNITFKNDFVTKNKSSFDASMQKLDFSLPSAPKKINSWVSTKTHKKIPKIINSVSPADVLYLINAIYFKGDWQHAFKKELTKNKEFALENGNKKTVSMMHMRRSDFRYFETENVQAVKLKYKDYRLSLCLFLPKKSSSLSMFEANLTKKKWNQYMSMFSNRKGMVGVPKFKIKDNIVLNKSLKELGMSRAFSAEKANFKLMADCKENIYISKVLHKTFMEVDEIGTEAAAVTAVIMKRAAAMVGRPVAPFRMIMDRPFLFALHDSKTNTVLFMGHIAEPS